MGVLYFFNLTDFINRFGTNVFIESGTGDGDGLLYATSFSFKKLYSIEYVSEVANKAKERFTDEKVRIIDGDSPTWLRRILPFLEGENILFWLDAHFPGLDHTKENKIFNVSKDISTPLENELRAIKSCRPKGQDVILIDDLRIYVDGEYELGKHPHGEPVGNIDFVYELFSDTHNIDFSYSHTGYLILVPKGK
jgi:hypothetical protein